MFIIKHRIIFVAISAILVIVSVVLLATRSLNLGIDFVGGSVLEVSYSEVRPSVSVLEETLRNAGYDARVQPFGEKGIILRTRAVSEDEHQSILSLLAYEGARPTEERFNSIGPSIGREIKTKAILSIVLACFAIVLFIAFVFRHVSEPVSSWKYGIVAIVALIHDSIIPMGIFALLGKEVDSLFVVGILSILGISINDTIVVFDRIRENLRTNVSKGLHEPYAETVGKSLRQTVVRSASTSFAVILVLVTLFVLGPVSTRDLALVLLLGISFGTYSSIFVAAPLLVMWNRQEK